MGERGRHLVRERPMMERRFPRLLPAQAKLEMERLHGKALEALLGSLPALPDLSTARFAPTGPQKVSSQELRELQDALRAVMKDSGFPNQALDVRQSVDRSIAVCLAEARLPFGEMLRRDVWAWLAIHLLPEYLVWRWRKNDGTITEERGIGPILRNALGRLWLRGVVLDKGEAADDRWSLVRRIPEDATVALLERTTVSANHALTRHIAEAWLSVGLSGDAAQDLLRNAMTEIRVRTALVEVSALDDESLRAFAEVPFAKITAAA